MSLDLKELQSKLLAANEELDRIRTRCQEQRMVLAHLESELVAIKEVAILLTEQLRVETERQDFTAVEDVARKENILAFKLRFQQSKTIK